MLIHTSIFSLLILFVSGCATVGPTVLIETPEPANDFVVICSWYQTPLLALHGGGKLVSESVYLAQTNEKISCGPGIGDSAIIKIMHPIYIEPEIIKQENISVYRYTKSKLDILDEKKIKFDEGFWNKHKNPGFEYAHDLPDCGFDHLYFDYYIKVKKVEVNYFKQKYHETMLQCLTQTFKITKQYRPAASSQLPSAIEYMHNMWSSDKWPKYE